MSISYGGLIRTLMQRDFAVAMRRRSDIINPLLFLLMVISLFPIAVGPGPDILGRIAAGVIWVTALLSSLLGLERLFRDDYHDGSLEQLCLVPMPLALCGLAKIAMHWLLTGLPLVILTPLLAVMLNLPSVAIVTLTLTVLIGTPMLSAVGAIGAALTVSLQRGGTLVSLILIPLFIPLLIFAMAAVDAALYGQSTVGQLSLLAGFSLLTLTLAPVAVAAALKVSIE